MCHDDYGPAYDPRHGREREASPHEEGVTEEDARSRVERCARGGGDEREDGLERFEKEIVGSALEQARECLADAVPKTAANGGLSRFIGENTSSMRRNVKYPLALL